MDKKAKNIIIFISGCLILGSIWLLYSQNPASNILPTETFTYYQPIPTPDDNLTTIEQDAEIKIPTSARELYAMVSGFRELDTWVRFDLPESDLQKFLTGTRCDSTLTQVSPQDFSLNAIDLDWWQPNKAKYLEICQGGTSTLQQTVMVDRTDPHMLRIYVFSLTDNFSTP
jgi:hypothetical protein